MSENQLTKAARPPKTPPIIAPTGGLELSTAAPGEADSVLLLNGPAGGTILDNGAGVEAAGTIGTAVGGLPLPLLIRATLS